MPSFLGRVRSLRETDMRKSRFTEEQIIKVLKEHAAGLSAGELCRKYGISDATFRLTRKKLYRLYKEERLTVRKRGGRKRALGTRAPIAMPQGANQRWSLDFLSDALIDSRRFRILAIVDEFSRECLALVADNSLSGLRVAR